MKQQPSIDFVQVFCSNFPSQRDLSNREYRWRYDVHWPKQFEKDISLSISRYSLEVFQLVLDESVEHKYLAGAVLYFYAPLPVDRFCDCSLIANALVNTGLADMNQNTLAEQVAVNVKSWLERAVEKAQKLRPDLELAPEK